MEAKMNLSLIQAFLCSTGLKVENIYTTLAWRYVTIIDKKPPMDIDNIAPFLLAMVGVIPYIGADYTVTMYQNNNTINATVFLDGAEIITFLAGPETVMILNPSSMHCVHLKDIDLESELISKLFLGIVTTGVNIERTRSIVRYLLNMQDLLDPRVQIDVEEVLIQMKQNNDARGVWLEELIVKLPVRYNQRLELALGDPSVPPPNNLEAAPYESATPSCEVLELFQTACVEAAGSKLHPDVEIKHLSSTDFQVLITGDDKTMCYGIVRFEDYPPSLYVNLQDGSDFDTVDIPTDTLTNFVQHVRGLLIGAPWYRLDGKNVTIKQKLDNFIFHVLETLTTPTQAKD